MVSEYTIVGIAGSHVDLRLSVPSVGLCLGREQGNHVVLDDSGVSRRHARIVPHEGSLWVQDLGSRNGVLVNGARIQGSRQLEPGDRIQLGRCVFEVASGLEATPPTRDGWGRRVLLSAPVLAGALLLFLVTARADGPVPSIRAPSTPSLLQQTLLEAEEPPVGLVELAPEQRELTVSIPDPPAGATAGNLLEEAHALFDAGRLADAKLRYQQALMLDEGCAVCQSRIDRLNARIAEDIALQMDAGARYLDELRVEEAIASWQVVLLLEPEASSRVHQQAKENIEEARKRSMQQF